MSKARDYYWQESLVRTLQTIKDSANSKKLSCAHQPLLEIPLQNVILDELHLMLRVTGTCSLFCQTLLVYFVFTQHN